MIKSYHNIGSDNNEVKAESNNSTDICVLLISLTICSDHDNENNDSHNNIYDNNNNIIYDK